MNTPTRIDPLAPRAARTGPPLLRGSMTPQRWFGFLRGLLFALWPGMRFAAVAAEPPAWAGAARRRRRALLAIVLALAAAAMSLQLAARPEDAGALWWAEAVLSTLLLAWVGAGFATALMGAWVMLRGDRHALAPAPAGSPIDPGARTALAMPICNEDVATVFGGLSATCESLAATGALSLFDVFILSDTSDPELRAAELRAWQELREQLGDGEGEAQRIFYRWRRRRTKRKAGNIADFCRRWGRRYRYMVVLDADSTMHGETLVSLVRIMERHPRVGIAQTLPMGAGHHTVHARLQQFASRVVGRLFALGMAYWQLGESHYWGHNAILRVQPFMRHCGLGRLPGHGGLAGEILSHDFVEAALMRRAGYEVWLAPQLEGSWEQHPANLLEELQRDRRWCQGNLQNARLIAEPGWKPAHRVMFAVGALSYAVAPLWLLFIALGLMVDPLAGDAEAALAMKLQWALAALLLLLPRLLGVLAVRWRGEQRQFGGTLRLASSALLELGLSAVQAPVRMLAHTAFVLSALTGLRLDWKSPARDAEAVAWRDALRRIGSLALPPLLLAALMIGSQHLVAWPLLPWLLPLALAVPFAVWSGHPRAGAVVRDQGLLLTPEERALPRTLARAAEHPAFERLRPPPRPRPVTIALRIHRSRWALAAAVPVLAVAMLVPHTALTPELTPELERLAFLPPLPEIMPVALPTIRIARPRPVHYRPARMIDDAVRRRAFEAVERALAAESEANPA